MAAPQQMLMSYGAAAASNQVLLLRANTSNGTVPVDDSSYAHVPSGTTGIVQNTAAKFGAAGMAFTAYNKYLDYAYASEWDFGSGDFTIQMWVKLRSDTGDVQSVFSQGVSPFAAANFGVELRVYPAAGGGLLLFSGGSIYSASIHTNLGTTAFSHVAAVREGQTLRCYVGGVQTNAQTWADMGAVNVITGGATRIGTRINSTGSQQLDADIDDFQVIKGTCLYPGGTTFTPPGAL